MQEPVEQASHSGVQEPHLSPQDRYYQSMQDAHRSWQSSRQAVWELYQGLQAHHQIVQTRYEAVATAMTTEQDLTPLLDEYHEAVTHHRLLVHRFRQALKEHQQEVRADLYRRVQVLW